MPNSNKDSKFTKNTKWSNISFLGQYSYKLDNHQKISTLIMFYHGWQFTQPACPGAAELASKLAFMWPTTSSHGSDVREHIHIEGLVQTYCNFLYKMR